MKTTDEKKPGWNRASCSTSVSKQDRRVSEKRERILNQLQTIVNGQQATMSSLEISGLTGSRHDSVKRTIETLAAKGVIVQPQAVDEQSADSMGRMRATEVYVFAGDKGRRDSIIVVAQLCPEFTARIVDRWQELEANAAAPSFQIPTTLSGALMLAAQQAEQIEQQQAALAIAAPKAQALDRITLSDGSLCITNAAKALGIQPKRLFAWLQENQWIYRRAGGSGFVGYQSRIQVGYLDHKVTLVSRSDGTEKTVEQVLVTAKGLAKLAQAMGIEVAA